MLTITASFAILLDQNVLVLGIASGLISGYVFGLYFGGSTFIQYVAMRIVGYFRNYFPARPKEFLDYAAERILLRKVGRGYIFIHRSLLEYFADLTGTSR